MPRYITQNEATTISIDYFNMTVPNSADVIIYKSSAPLFSYTLVKGNLTHTPGMDMGDIGGGGGVMPARFTFTLSANQTGALDNTCTYKLFVNNQLVLNDTFDVTENSLEDTSVQSTFIKDYVYSSRDGMLDESLFEEGAVQVYNDTFYVKKNGAWVGSTQVIGEITVLPNSQTRTLDFTTLGFVEGKVYEGVVQVLTEDQFGMSEIRYLYKSSNGVLLAGGMGFVSTMNIDIEFLDNSVQITRLAGNTSDIIFRMKLVEIADEVTI
jgi:hypothetical protein